MMVKPESGGHWYAVGEPLLRSHTAIPAYDATLREARKENLLPSVTTVLKEKANRGLQAWKDEQLILAALTLPEVDGENLNDRAMRILNDSREQGRAAAEKGEVVHNILERLAKGEHVDLSEYDPMIQVGCSKAIGMMKLRGSKTLYCEDMFVNVELGYGCRVDWVGDLDGMKTIVDFKTMSTQPGKKIKGYDDWFMQLAANTFALPIAVEQYCNLVISTTEPGRVEWVEWSDDDIWRGWKMFQNLLSYFYLSRKFEYKRP